MRAIVCGARLHRRDVQQVEHTNPPRGHRPMNDTMQRSASHDVVVLAEAIEVIDKALAEIGSRQLVTTTEVADLLLDVRQLLNQKVESTTASSK